MAKNSMGSSSGACSVCRTRAGQERSCPGVRRADPRWPGRYRAAGLFRPRPCLVHRGPGAHHRDQPTSCSRPSPGSATWRREHGPPDERLRRRARKSTPAELPQNRTSRRRPGEFSAGHPAHRCAKARMRRRACGYRAVAAATGLRQEQRDLLRRWSRRHWSRPGRPAW